MPRAAPRTLRRMPAAARSSARGNRRIHLLGQRRHLRHRTVFSTSCTARCTSAATAVSATLGSDRQIVVNIRFLERVEIDRARRRFVQLQVLRVADDADDLIACRPVRERDMFSDRTFRRRSNTGHRLVDDGHARPARCPRTRNRGRQSAACRRSRSISGRPRST